MPDPSSSSTDIQTKPPLPRIQPEPEPPRGLVARFLALWDREIVQPLRDVENESRAFLASPESRRVDMKVIVTLVTVCVIVTLQFYIDSPQGLIWALRGLGLETLAQRYLHLWSDPEHGKLWQLVPFFLMQMLGGFVLPALVIRLVFRERVADYGTKLHGVLSGWWIYVTMIAVVTPFVIRASYHPSFQATYPYYRLASDEPTWPNMHLWEIAYLLQFFFIEFFLRGFMLHATKHRFGCYSIFVMTVPYCMIHFHKPMAETFGAIIAGIALGFMSLKTRSIWLGTGLHITVAVMMDSLALWHEGRWWW